MESTKSFIDQRRNLIEIIFKYLGNYEKSSLRTLIQDRKLLSILLKNKGKQDFHQDPSNLVELLTLSEEFQTDYWLDNQ